MTSACLKSWLLQMTFTSASDVVEQIRTGLYDSCRSLSPLGWTNNDIWSWYNGESKHTRALLKAILLHVQLTTAPGHTCCTASVNRPVCTEEDITASPRTELPWLRRGRGASLWNSGDWPIRGCCRTDYEVLKFGTGFSSCLHHNLSSRD